MGLSKRNKVTRPQESSDCAEKMHNKVSHINKNWVIGILAIIVVVLIAIVFSSRLFEKNNVARIISFTATILSIVLSLLAILYSYLGNIESFENLSEIRSAVSEIKATEDAIKHFISNMNVGMTAGGTNGASNKIEDENNKKKAPANNSATNDGDNSVGMFDSLSPLTDHQSGECINQQ